MQPSVVATAVNSQNPAHTSKTKLAAMCLYECVLHPDYLAKYAPLELGHFGLQRLKIRSYGRIRFPELAYPYVQDTL